MSSVDSLVTGLGTAVAVLIGVWSMLVLAPVAVDRSPSPPRSWAKTMAAHTHVALLVLPMNVQSSSACSSMISKSRNIRWLKRFAAVETRSSHRAMVWRAWPVTRAVAEILTPSTRRLATWSHCIAGVRVSRPHFNALCGRMKL